MHTLRLFLSVLLCTATLPALADDKASSDGFTLLFDGKTMSGWRKPYTWGQVEVVNGEIHLTGEKSSSS